MGEAIAGEGAGEDVVSVIEGVDGGNRFAPAGVGDDMLAIEVIVGDGLTGNFLAGGIVANGLNRKPLVISSANSQSITTVGWELIVEG